MTTEWERMGFSQVVVSCQKKIHSESMVPISKVGQSPWWTLAGFVATKMLPPQSILGRFWNLKWQNPSTASNKGLWWQRVEHRLVVFVQRGGFHQVCAQSKTNSRCTQSLCLTLYHVLADFGIQSDKIYLQRSKRACGDSALNADRRFLYREGGSINCTHSPKITYRQIEALDKLWESISLIPASCAPGSYAPRTQTTNRACQMPQAMARPHNLLLCHHHGSSR